MRAHAGRRTAARVDPAVLLAAVPDGLAVVGADGVLLEVNEAGARLFGSPAEALVGRASPILPPGPAGPAAGVGVGADLASERIAGLDVADGGRRDVACTWSLLPDRSAWVVAFRDVTDRLRRERRLAAIASAAASVAAQRSLPVTLEALAREIVGTEGFVAVQVLTLNDDGDRFEVMGTAGFELTDGFFDRLLECADRGAELATLTAFTRNRPVVVPDRYRTVMTDPAWAPLRDAMAHPRWQDFASLPLAARSTPVGVLNVFLAPGQSIGPSQLAFLVSMAEQAALAVENARLLDREGDVARREERQRLARDLHDSVVQQVFSMSMQARSLAVLARKARPPSPEAVAQVADDVGDIARTVLADLRAMVVELRPVSRTDRDLPALLRLLAEVTAARTGIEVLVDVHDAAGGLSRVDPDLLEDVHRVVAEAVHNAVKHAAPTTIGVHVAVEDGGRRLAVEVVDDGRGLDPRDGTTPAAVSPTEKGSGYGIQAMRERAQRWSGSLTLDAAPEGGTRVALVVPLPMVFRRVPSRRTVDR